MQNTYSRVEVPCIICGVKDEDFLFYTPERIVQCRRCGLMYNNPRLDFESLQKVYSKDYFVVEDDNPGIDYKAYCKLHCRRTAHHPQHAPAPGKS